MPCLTCPHTHIGLFLFNQCGWTTGVNFHPLARIIRVSSHAACLCKLPAFQALGVVELTAAFSKYHDRNRTLKTWSYAETMESSVFPCGSLYILPFQFGVMSSESTMHTIKITGNKDESTTWLTIATITQFCLCLLSNLSFLLNMNLFRKQNAQWAVIDWFWGKLNSLMFFFLFLFNLLASDET